VSWRYAVLSVLALFIVVLLILKNYEIWMLPSEVLPENGGVKKSEATTQSPSRVGVQKETKPIDSYVFISEKNIFNPERKEFSIQPGLGKKSIARPQVILYGVTVMGEYQSATLVDSTRPLRKGEREMLTLMKGEQIGEYKLAKILPDRITLEAADDTFEVLLYDPKVAKKRNHIKTEIKPAVITSTLPGAPSPELPKSAPRTTAEKPKAAPQERASTLPPIASPTPALTPPSANRRGRRIYFPPSGSPVLQGTPATQGVPGPTQETGGN
jgi:hypothetical protein